jgi:hypothetical protein
MFLFVPIQRAQNRTTGTRIFMNGFTVLRRTSASAVVLEREKKNLTENASPARTVGVDVHTGARHGHISVYLIV